MADQSNSKADCNSSRQVKCIALILTLVIGMITVFAVADIGDRKDLLAKSEAQEIRLREVEQSRARLEVRLEAIEALLREIRNDIKDRRTAAATSPKPADTP